MPDRPTRVLVITDHPEPQPALLAAIRERTGRPPVQFRVLVPNPAHAEVHLLHPERRDRADAAERLLRAHLAAFEEAAGGPVGGSVSVRNDPYDGVEAVMAGEPVDEFMVALSASGLSRALHLDLPHRLAHFGLPVHVVAGPVPVPA
ncbi:MAG: hypothetical protein JWN17_793 [Frankiales bacterium]|nr:hypothetical protein [Frankiales bacterium]